MMDLWGVTQGLDCAAFELVAPILPTAGKKCHGSLLFISFPNPTNGHDQKRHPFLMHFHLQ
jgi:hypothetical protein